MPMRSDVKGWWVDEGLLSGNYLQARDEFAGLHPQDNGKIERETCCLAVLTDISIKHGCEGVRWDERDPSVLLVERRPEHYDAEELFADADAVIDGVPYDVWGEGDLPEPVREWAGLDDANPVIDCVEAIERNDARGESFEDIARAIQDDPDL